MRPTRIALLAALAIAALVLGVLIASHRPAHAARLLRGDMPRLPVAAAPPPAASAEPLAPVPNPDLMIPASRPAEGPTLRPILTDRRAGEAAASQGYAPGSAYSSGLARKGGEPATNLGTVLAPGVQLTIPLR